LLKLIPEFLLCFTELQVAFEIENRGGPGFANTDVHAASLCTANLTELPRSIKARGTFP
jgi:hypothetical protein